MSIIFSRQCEYALQAVVYLALRGDGEKTSIRDLTKRLDIPYHFLAKILQDLVKTGLIKSVRGTGGGFVLARQPEQITLREIVEAIEGPIMPNTCLMGEGVCSFQKTCTVHPVWRRLQSVTRGILEEVTLKTLTAGG